MPLRDTFYSHNASALLKLAPAVLVILGSEAAAQEQMGIAGQAPPAQSSVTETSELSALQGFSFDGIGSLTGIYTSNGTGLPSSYRTASLQHGSDFITSLNLNLALHNRTARFQGDLQYLGSAYLHANNSSLNNVFNYVNGLARAVLVPEHVLLDFRAFAAPILVSRLGPLSAEDRPIASGTNSGRRDTYGYTIAPDFIFRLGDFATTETTFSHGSVFFFRPHGPEIEDGIPGEIPTTQATTYGVTERFASGSAFDRLAWGITGTANKMTRISGGLEEASGAADVSYALSRGIAVLGTAGYASITTDTQNLTHSLVGPIALGGIAISGARLEAEFRAGWQYNYSSYTGRIRYQLGPFTVVNGSLSDSITTPGLNFLGGVGRLGVNNQGDFFDTDYQFDQTTPTAFTDEFSFFNPAPINQIGAAIGSASISRFRRGILSLLHQSDRTRYRISALTSVRDRLTESVEGLPPSEDVKSITGVISRTLTPLVTGNVTTEYSIHNVFGGENEIFRTSVGLSWQMTPIMSSFLRAAYLHRTSDRALVAVAPLSDNLSDVNIIVGVSRQLF
jgi:hypothetical protein